MIADNDRGSLSRPHALLVDDDKETLLALDGVVRPEGFTTSLASSIEEAKDRLAHKTPDVALIDLMLPDGSGLELIEEVPEAATQRTEYVMMSGRATLDAAINALRGGVADFLIKPVDLRRLRKILARVLAEHNGGLQATAEDPVTAVSSSGFGRLIGTSDAMQRVYQLVQRVAPVDASVLITGETGTGKELIAATIHHLSRRRRGPFVAVNCGAVSPALIESELFGHEKGSFTGAHRTHHGCFEQASGGTIFLDEVGEMPHKVQTQLLRVLENSVFRRVGAERDLETDVRVIAATNRVPAEQIRNGAFREDLFYRLNVFPITLPPLRERGKDAHLLAEHFLAELNRQNDTDKSFANGCLDELTSHRWPGNVRQLRNFVYRRYLLHSEVIPVDACREVDQALQLSEPDSLTFEAGISLKQAERQLIEFTLARFDGDKNKTAQALGISLKTLYNRLSVYRADG